MEEKLALVNSLALLYTEHLIGEDRGNYNTLIKEVSSLIKLPDIVSGNDDRAVLVALRHIITGLIDGTKPYERAHLLKDFRISCPFERATYSALEEVLLKDTDETAHDTKQLKRDLVNYANALTTFVSRTEIKKKIGAVSFRLNTVDDMELDDVCNELELEISKFRSRSSKKTGEQSSFVERVNANDTAGLAAVFKETQKELNGKALKTGWKAINRMCGAVGGLVPGECVVMPALPHNAKTTFSLLLTISMALFNDAADFAEDGKIPTILDLTLENELRVNLPIVYRAIREYRTGQPCDIRNVTPEEAAEYIQTELAKRGWLYVFERHISSDFTIDTLRNIIETYESKGHKIVVARVDYLGVINKTGLSNGQNGSEVREVYRRARNLSSRKKTLLISPHQLSPAAKAFAAMDPDRYVRELPGRGYYDGCTTVDNEVDLELFFGITKKMYLEVQRGKHRTIIETPIKDRYCVLKFSDIGILPWDVELKHELSLTSVGADAMAKEEDDYFSFSG